MPLERRTGGISKVLNTFTDTAAGLSPSTFEIVQGTDGNYLLVIGCTGLTNQVQVFDAVTGQFIKKSYQVTTAQQGVQQTVFVPTPRSILTVSGAGIDRVTPDMESKSVGTLGAGYTAGYEPTLDAKGHVWIGAYGSGGKGTFARLEPSSGNVTMMKSISRDTDYVRCVSVAGTKIWGGTGNVKPRLVSMDTSTPGVYKTYVLPNAVQNGYVQWIEAWTDVVMAGYKQTDGQNRTALLDVATGKVTVLAYAVQGEFVERRGDKLYYFDARYLKTYDVKTGKAAVVVEYKGFRPLAGKLIGDGTTLKMLAAAFDSASGTYRTIRMGVASKQVEVNARVGILPSAFKLQTIHTSMDGYLYSGGYQGDSISRINRDTGAVRRSTKADPINQVEGMVDLDRNTLYVGSYESADIIKYYRPTGVSRSIANLGQIHQQSRPYGMAIAAGKIVVGCVPAQGLQGGGLSVIDPKTEKVVRHLEGVVGKHSIVGLYGRGNIVYGTSTRRAAYGAADAPGWAQVFAYDVAANTLLWRTTLENEGEIDSPIQIGGYIYVSVANGVVRLRADDGRPNGTYRIFSTRKAQGYRTTRIAYHAKTGTVVHAAGGQLTAIQVNTGTTWTLAQGNYSYPVIGTDGRLFAIHGGRDISELEVFVPAA